MTDSTPTPATVAAATTPAAPVEGAAPVESTEPVTGYGYLTPEETAAAIKAHKEAERKNAKG